MYPQVLFKNRRPDRIATLEEYRAGGGYQALAEVVTRGPAKKFRRSCWMRRSWAAAAPPSRPAAR